MSKRVSTLLSWIEAHEARCISEQAVLARREGEWGEAVPGGKTPGQAVSAPAGMMRGFGLWLAQAAGELFGRRGRPA